MRSPGRRRPTTRRYLKANVQGGEGYDVDSELFGSTNTFGWFAPLSTAGQPVSMIQNGFDCGTHDVGDG